MGESMNIYELVDAAKPIIELWEAKTPAQIEWKREWLDSANRIVVRFKRGDRVTRPFYMDNGVWAKEGDKCLANSPLRHGTVIGRSVDRDDEVVVRWDSGETRFYLDHGLRRE